MIIAADTDIVIAGTTTIDPRLVYKFTRFHHPHTCLFLKQLYEHGVDGLLRPDPAWGSGSAELYRQLMPSTEPTFKKTYSPSSWVYDNFRSDLLEDQIDFDHGSPCGSSNWSCSSMCRS